VERVLTTCPCCACGCALYLHVRDGRTVGTAPSLHHPVSRGRLCARGWNAHEAPAWGERLTRPMVRRGGALQPADWDEALDHARSGLSTLVQRGSPVGVLGSARGTNEENYLATRLARGALGTGNLDSCLRATYQPLVDGIASVLGRMPTATFEEIAACGAIVVLESDLAATHPQVVHTLIQARKAGCRLVTIGCVRTQLARLATLHLVSRPGERAAVVGGLVAALLREGGPVRLAGAEELMRSVAPLPVDDAARLAAGWLAETERVGVVVAPEGGTSEHGNREGSAVAALAALAGRARSHGTAVMVLPARGNLRGACEMGVVPDRLPGTADLEDAAAVERVTRAWGRSPALAAGLSAEAMTGAVHGMVVFADDPPAVLPAGSRALDILAASECLVVLDAFVTPTVRAANVALPIASHAECEGTATGAEGRVQRLRAATRPPGEARPGWQALADLSAAFGLPQPYRSAADVTREISTVVPSYARVSERVMSEAWGAFTEPPVDGNASLRPFDTGRAVTAAPAVLALEGVFDWGSDPAVSFSPTLRRDHVSRRKLYPHGVVQMCQGDADRLGVRPGRPVRVISAYGEAVLPVVVRGELEPGVVLVPYAFRDSLAGVLAGRSEVAVRAERAQ